MNAHTSPSQPVPDVALQVLRRIEAARRPIITSHIRLDGDAIGAALALAHMLKARDAAPHVVNDSVVPKVFRFLPGLAEVGTSPADVRGGHDLLIVLDTPAWSRARAVRDALPKDIPIVGIDHHSQIDRMGDLVWADQHMSSVGEMVYHLASAGNWPIPPEAATCLYVAIVTDTGRFTFPNTSPAALRAVADLIERGADHLGSCRRLYQEESPALVALRAEATQGIKRYADGRIAVMKLTRGLLRRTGVHPIDTQDIADIPRSLAGTLVGVLLREMTEEGKVKVSLRSKNSLNIEPIARKFGGGGHRQAAGCEISAPIEQVEGLVVGEIQALLDATTS